MRAPWVVVLCALFPLTAVAQDFDAIEGRAAASMTELVSSYSDSLGLALEFEPADFRLLGPIDDEDITGTARRVVEAAAIRSTAGLGFEISPAGGVALSPEQVEVFAGSLLEYGLLRPGFYLADVTWRLPSGQTFGTIGTVDPEGIPRFEPILYFSVFTTDSRTVERGSWILRGSRLLKNGFGITCVDVTWSTRISTNGARIEDPAPHVNVDRAIKNCPLWDLAVTYGELPLWCRSGGNGFPNCRTSTGRAGEHCLDWVVATHVVTGFSEIEVEADVAGSYRGIKTNATVRFVTEPFGSEAIFGDKGRLCATRGPG